MNTIIGEKVFHKQKRTRFQPLPAKVMVRNSDIGQGVFAARTIEAGEEIFRLIGKIIGLKEVLDKGEEKSPMPVQIQHQTYIDVESPAKYLNHSCDPNSGLINDTVLIALRSIKKNEEIRFDYSTTMSEELWTMRCTCGSENCRGRIKDFHYLPIGTQLHYLQLGIVQQFIVQEVLDRYGSLRLSGLRIGVKFTDPCLTKNNKSHIWQ